METGWMANWMDFIKIQLNLIEFRRHWTKCGQTSVCFEFEAPPPAGVEGPMFDYRRSSPSSLRFGICSDWTQNPFSHQFSPKFWCWLDFIAGRRLLFPLFLWHPRRSRRSSVAFFLGGQEKRERGRKEKMRASPCVRVCVHFFFFHFLSIPVRFVLNTRRTCFWYAADLDFGWLCPVLVFHSPGLWRHLILFVQISTWSSPGAHFISSNMECKSLISIFFGCISSDLFPSPFPVRFNRQK